MIPAEAFALPCCSGQDFDEEGVLGGANSTWGAASIALCYTLGHSCSWQGIQNPQAGTRTDRLGKAGACG